MLNHYVELLKLIQCYLLITLQVTKAKSSLHLDRRHRAIKAEEEIIDVLFLI